MVAVSTSPICWQYFHGILLLFMFISIFDVRLGQDSLSLVIAICPFK